MQRQRLRQVRGRESPDPGPDPAQQRVRVGCAAHLGSWLVRDCRTVRAAGAPRVRTVVL